MESASAGGRGKPRTSDSRGPRLLDENISNCATSQSTTLLALERFLPFQGDDWNRNQRGGGVYPTDMKHRIKDQAGKGYAGKVGTRISIRLSAPKAKSTGLRARQADKESKGALHHHPDQRDHLQPHNLARYFAGSSCAFRGVRQCPAPCFFFKAHSAYIVVPG